MLCRKQSGTAVIDMCEENLFNPDQYSWNELRGLVRRYADALRASGAEKGDIVACKSLSPRVTSLHLKVLDLELRKLLTDLLCVYSGGRQLCAISCVVAGDHCNRSCLLVLCDGYWRKGRLRDVGRITGMKIVLTSVYLGS